MAVQDAQKVGQLRNRPGLHREAQLRLCRGRIHFGIRRVRQPTPLHQHRPEPVQQRPVVACDASVPLNRQVADPVGAGRHAQVDRRAAEPLRNRPDHLPAFRGVRL